MGSLKTLNKYQRGQGMVGFIVAATFFVIPTAIGINYLARIGDAKHKTYEAARYAAWERTVWHQNDNTYNVKADIDISREINHRVFGLQNRPLDSRVDRQRVADPSTIAYDPFLYNWENVNNGRASIVETPNQQNAEPNTLNISDSRAPGNIASVINTVASNRLGLTRNGLYNAQIDVRLHRDENILSELNNALGNNNNNNNPNFLTASSNNAMFVGAWNANGPSGVRQSVRGLVLTSLLDNGFFNAIQRVAGFGFEEIRPNSLIWGHIDPERVPCHRLRTPRNQGNGC